MSTKLEQLQGTITTMDSLSQDGFSEIYTLAKMALDLMETDRAYHCPETLARVLRTIWATAIETENCINCEAENVGCNYKDEFAKRRHKARLAAEASLIEQRNHGTG